MDKLSILNYKNCIKLVLILHEFLIHFEILFEREIECSCRNLTEKIWKYNGYNNYELDRIIRW